MSGETPREDCRARETGDWRDCTCDLADAAWALTGELRSERAARLWHGNEAPTLDFNAARERKVGAPTEPEILRDLLDWRDAEIAELQARVARLTRERDEAREQADRYATHSRWPTDWTKRWDSPDAFRAWLARIPSGKCAWLMPPTVAQLVEWLDAFDAASAVLRTIARGVPHPSVTALDAVQALSTTYHSTTTPKEAS